MCIRDRPHTILALCPGHPDPAWHEVLFIHRSTAKDDIWLGHYISKEEAVAVSGIRNICWFEEFGHVISEMMQHCKNVYLNEIPLKCTITKEINLLEDRLRGLFPGQTYGNLTPMITELRQVKEYEELALIREAATITGKAFERLAKAVKPGVKEYALEAELMYGFLLNGATGAAFETIVASGSNACILHYVRNDKTMHAGELVLVDFGAEYANYAADCTRVLPVSGVFSKRQRECYEAVLLFHDEAVKLMKPGTTIEEINHKIYTLMQEHHIRLGLYSQQDVDKQTTAFECCKNYFMHSVSHFLGIDVHDVGSRKHVLKPGMVITCEPGLYIREEGIGIRLENDILITENEAINLTEHIPIKPSEIEYFMK